MFCLFLDLGFSIPLLAGFPFCRDSVDSDKPHSKRRTERTNLSSGLLIARHYHLSTALTPTDCYSYLHFGVSVEHHQLVVR